MQPKVCGAAYSLSERQQKWIWIIGLPHPEDLDGFVWWLIIGIHLEHGAAKLEVNENDKRTNSWGKREETENTGEENMAVDTELSWGS